MVRVRRMSGLAQDGDWLPVIDAPSRLRDRCNASEVKWGRKGPLLLS